MPLMRHGLLTDPGDPRAARPTTSSCFGPDLLAAPVLEPGARTRRLYLPRGRWVDLWRSARYATRRRQPAARRRARLLRGGGRATLPAPRDELPLLVRAGAVLPLLPADVDTLAPYRGRAWCAWPTAATACSCSRSRAGARSRAWARGASGCAPPRRRAAGRSRCAASGARTYPLQAALGTLRRPFRPRRVLLGGRPLPRSAWSYDAPERASCAWASAAGPAVLTVRG